jgi:hypothetical protein
MTRDLREFTRNTQNRLVFGFVLLAFVVGVGLIYIFYGKGAALVGLGCLLAAMLPVAIVMLFLWFTERMVKKHDE